LHNGELFVTARLKDLIIIRGQNYYPQDGEERLVVVQEVQRAWLRKLNTREVFEAIHRAVLERYEILVHAILLLKPERLPKTSSSKVQRRACRGQFMAGILESVGKWQQPKIRETAPSQIEVKTVKDWLLNRISQLTNIPPDQINTRHRFVHYGIDSVTAASLSGELSKWLGRPLPAALVYDYPNIDSLARYLSTHQETMDEQGPSSEPE